MLFYKRSLRKKINQLNRNLKGVVQKCTKFDKYLCKQILWVLPTSWSGHTQTHINNVIISSLQQVARRDK